MFFGWGLVAVSVASHYANHSLPDPYLVFLNEYEAYSFFRPYKKKGLLKKQGVIFI